MIEKTLDQLLPDVETPPKRLNLAIRHSLMNGGKRLRPILVLACAEAVDSPIEPLLPMACALECIHTYSLIHDDLPAMDDDDLRRGRTTCHKQFDEATAILAGDALLTYAFELASQPMAPIKPKHTLMVIHQLAKEAGIMGMVGGQMLDMLAEKRDITLQELKTIHAKKTGALLHISCTAGAQLGGGTSDQIQRLSLFGKAIGLAFQITDDILDEIGDSHIMGKTSGQDREKSKATYPKLMGLKQSKKEAENQIHQAITHLEPFSEKAKPLRDLAHFILTRTH